MISVQLSPSSDQYIYMYKMQAHYRIKTTLSMCPCDSHSHDSRHVTRIHYKAKNSPFQNHAALGVKRWTGWSQPCSHGVTKYK